MKQRIREMAGALMKIAAARILKEAPRLVPPEGLYDEFAARFPYDETEDQMNSIEAVLDDMGSGRPMDRLVCGDVGFGKTEVALRAAFVAAMSGKQVAIVVPTTLLARQHYRTFCDRFRGFPLQVAQASRFVPAAEMKKVKEGWRTAQSTSSWAPTRFSVSRSSSGTWRSSSWTRSSISASATRSA
jgi:transcription-repair coupling factor (superfamily II helicase)